MLKNAIAYILRKRSRTVIIFIILTIVLSCLYSCLNIMKSAISLENNLYKLSNTSLSITQNNNENFKINQFKEIENIKEIKETIPKYDGLAKSTNIKAVEGMQMIERDDMPEEFKNIFSIEATNNTGKDNLFNSGVFTLIKGRHIDLSLIAARKLGLVSKGVERVSFTIVEPSRKRVESSDLSYKPQTLILTVLPVKWLVSIGDRPLGNSIGAVLGS